MKVAITGGLGHIGKELLEVMPEDVEAIVISRTVRDQELRVGARMYPVRGTDYSPVSLRRILRDCDAVVHLAAQRLKRGNDVECLVNALRDYDVFRACEEQGIRNVVFASSRGVYGKGPAPWLEISPLEPDNPYALAKVQSEQSAAYFNRRGMRIKSLRIAQVLGPGEREDSMIMTFLRKARAGEPLEITVTGDIAREYIYTRDLAQAIWKAVASPDISGFFNVGSGETCSVEDMARWMNEAFENEGNMKMAPYPIVLNENSLMDSTLFRTTYDWKPEWSLREAVQDIRARMGRGGNA